MPQRRGAARLGVPRQCGGLAPSGAEWRPRAAAPPPGRGTASTLVSGHQPKHPAPNLACTQPPGCRLQGTGHTVNGGGGILQPCCSAAHGAERAAQTVRGVHTPSLCTVVVCACGGRCARVGQSLQAAVTCPRRLRGWWRVHAHVSRAGAPARHPSSEPYPAAAPLAARAPLPRPCSRPPTPRTQAEDSEEVVGRRKRAREHRGRPPRERRQRVAAQQPVARPRRVRGGRPGAALVCVRAHTHAASHTRSTLAAGRQQARRRARARSALRTAPILRACPRRARRWSARRPARRGGSHSVRLSAPCRQPRLSSPPPRSAAAPPAGGQPAAGPCPSGVPMRAPGARFLLASR